MFVPFPWTNTSSSNSRKKLHSLPLSPSSQARSHFLTHLLMGRAGFLPPKLSLSPLALLSSSSCCGAEGCQPSSHQADRASLCSINYAIALSHYAVAATFILWHWGQHLLYSHMWLCRSMRISPGGTFPLTLLGTGRKWYFHLEDWEEFLFVICFPPAAARSRGRREEGGPSSISATTAREFGLCIF